MAGAWLFLKIFFIVLDFALLGFFLFAFYQGWKMRPTIEFRYESPDEKALRPVLRKEMVQKRWQAVRAKAEENFADAPRIAVLEADALLDDVLKMLGTPGEHLADRLGAFDAGEVKSLDRVWRAHRLRNDLVHTAGFTASPEETIQALNDFEEFLKEIGAM